MRREGLDRAGLDAAPFTTIGSVIATVPPLPEVIWKSPAEYVPTILMAATRWHDAMLQWIILRLGTALLKRKLDPMAATAAQQ